MLLSISVFLLAVRHVPVVKVRFYGAGTFVPSSATHQALDRQAVLSLPAEDFASLWSSEEISHMRECYPLPA
jgi:hypothetical protein